MSFEHFLQDFRYGIRMLTRHRGFSAVAIATLALGIGVNTIIFGLANALFLRPAPVSDPDRVLRAYSNRHSNTDYSIYQQYRDRTRTLSGLALFQGASASLRADRAPEHVFAMVVTGNYFEVLGVRAALGRVIADGDDRGAAGVVVLSDRTWRTRFDGSPSVIGRPLAINGQAFTIVGVAPAT